MEAKNITFNAELRWLNHSPLPPTTLPLNFQDYLIFFSGKLALALAHTSQVRNELHAPLVLQVQHKLLGN